MLRTGIVPSTWLTTSMTSSRLPHNSCRPDVSRHIDIICGEVPSSTGYLKPTNWEPNLFIEISNEDLDSKVNSMLGYKGESRPDPHPRSPEVLRALAKVRGSESGFFFAEAFMTNKVFL